jgi:hypothetical protein
MDKPISIEEIAKLKEQAAKGEITDIGTDGQTFNVRIKKLSILELCRADVIPNELLATALEVYEGRQKSNFKRYAEVVDIVCNLCLVEPKYEDIKDILTDGQKEIIYSICQHGVAGYKSFRKILELQAGNRSSKK